METETNRVTHARFDLSVDDTAGKTLPEVRELRDEIDRRVAALLGTRRLDPPLPAPSLYLRLKV